MFSRRMPFDIEHITQVPRGPGVYTIFDLAGPIYIGRSGTDIQERLRRHFHERGNKNITLARRIGAGDSLTFSYRVMPKRVQRDAEALLIHQTGVLQYANLRKEALPEANRGGWRKWVAEVKRVPGTRPR